MVNTKGVRDLECGDRETFGVSCAKIQATGCFIYYDSYLIFTHFTDTVFIGYHTEIKAKGIN